MSSIAYINTNFTALSHTFIYREVLGLRNRGIPVKTYSIRKPDLNSLSREAIDLYYSTSYLIPIDLYKFIKAHLCFFFSQPLTYVGTLFFLVTRKFKHKIKDRIRTLFHFCEGVYFARLVKEDDIKHIHAHYASHPTSIAMVASILSKIPFSFTAHAFDIWIDELFLKEKVCAAEFVITCTGYGKECILDVTGIKNPEKITVIYHGVDIKKFEPAREAHKYPRKTILNVGRLSEEKAQDNLIMACKLLKDEGYEFECHIVGDGPLVDYLQKLIEKNQLQEYVRLVGKVFQENIKEYYQNANIFVLPSTWGENLPNVLLESLAMGVPVIATDIAGIPELIKDRLTGILVKPNDVEGLARAIKFLINDENMAKMLSENGRRLVCRDFDGEKSLDQLVSLYSLNRVITN